LGQRVGNWSPCIPYAHKYWSRLSAQGLPRTIGSLATQINPLRILGSGASILMGRPGGLGALLVAIEALICKGLPVRGVFLQNAAFDILMAIEAHRELEGRELEGFADAVENHLNAIHAFITMNRPKAIHMLCDEIGFDQPWICANFNLGGFRTNPSKAAVEASFASRRSRNIAMSVFSSGKASGQSSRDYAISKMSYGAGVDARLFGSSNPKNIEANAQVILGCSHEN